MNVKTSIAFSALLFGLLGCDRARATPRPAMVLPDVVSAHDAGNSPAVLSETINAVVSLAEPLRTVPHCGVLAFAVVGHFRVVRVLEGSYPHQDIYVGLYCPEMNPVAQAARVGVEQTLRLQRQTVRGVTLIDLDQHHELPRYWPVTEQNAAPDDSI